MGLAVIDKNKVFKTSKTKDISLVGRLKLKPIRSKVKNQIPKPKL